MGDCRRIRIFRGWSDSGRDRRSGLGTSPCWAAFWASLFTTSGTVRKKCIPTRMRTEGSREFAYHFPATNYGRTRRTHPPLHADRAYSSLGGRPVLHLLFDHRLGFLVPRHVLACGTGWRRTDCALLASLDGPRLHGVHVLDVQNVAWRYGYDRSRLALEEGGQALHRERRPESAPRGPLQLGTESVFLADVLRRDSVGAFGVRALVRGIHPVEFALATVFLRHSARRCRSRHHRRLHHSRLHGNGDDSRRVYFDHPR